MSVYAPIVATIGTVIAVVAVVAILTKEPKRAPVDYGGGLPEVLCQRFGGVRTVLKHGRTQIRESYYTVAEVSCNDGSTIERNYWEIVR